MKHEGKQPEKQAIFLTPDEMVVVAIVMGKVSRESIRDMEADVVQGYSELSAIPSEIRKAAVEVVDSYGLYKKFMDAAVGVKAKPISIELTF